VPQLPAKPSQSPAAALPAAGARLGADPDRVAAAADHWQRNTAAAGAKALERERRQREWGKLWGETGRREAAKRRKGV